MNHVSLPTPDTFPDLLLTMTALSGEFPSALVGRLPGSEYYKRNAVTRVKKMGLIYKYSRDGLQGLRLTSTAKNLLLTQQPDRYENILVGDSMMNAPKYTIVRRTRLHRMAEVLVSMFNADVLILPWKKSDIFQKNSGTALADIDQPAYYTSLEIKGSGDQGKKFTGSRATGILFANDNIYLTFNTGTSEMKWDAKSEERLKSFVTYDLCLNKQAGPFWMKKTDAIMFASDMSQLETLMCGGKKKGRKQTVLDGFDCFHYITNDYRGEIVLRFLCNPQMKKGLDSILLEGWTPVNGSYHSIECDAIDENHTPVLFGYTCDMFRIRRFNAGLTRREMMGTLICFDFQEDSLRRVCGPQVQFQCLDFAVVDRLILYS